MDESLNIDTDTQAKILEEHINKAQSRLKARGINPLIEICPFVPLSEIVPKNCGEGFWSTLSENAPFSWGDNNRTLIKASRLKTHCQECISYLDDEKTIKEFEKIIQSLKELEDIDIDLEN